MKKQSKLTRNQFRKMIQEEISNLTDLVLEEEGDVAADDEEEGEEEEDEDAAMAKGDAAQPPEDNNDMSKLQTEKKLTKGMGSISEDEDEGENKPPESALRKIAGSDDIHQFLLLRDENKGNAGSWVVKKVGDRVELRPTVDFAEALSKWFIKNERDPAWTIEFRETTERDSMDESKKITKGMVLKMLREEFQNVMSEDDEYGDDIDWLGGEEDEGAKAKAIAQLEILYGELEGEPQRNLEVFIDWLKDLPGAPLGNAIAMAGWDPES